MAEMTSHERFKRMFEHRDADRIPIIDNPWRATIERWQQEGMPAEVNYVDYFGLDRVATIGVDTSPRYPVQLIEDTDAYSITTSPWGATFKNFKHVESTPEFLDFKIVDRASWQEAKDRMTPTPDRINWEHLKKAYPQWKKDGYWIQGGFWFGFDITHAWNVGTERLLVALGDDPEWCMDMFSTELDMCIALMDQVWDAGYTFDAIHWPDDMGYKHSQFFSVATYRRILKPFHQRAVDWAHAKGIKAHLHSCGDVNPFVPELIDIGVDALNPLEVKAGMDPLYLKKTFGDKLVLHGGINALLYDDIDALEAELRKIVPTVKQHGGYILSSDHSVPSSMSLHDFKRFVELGKELGSYE
ncbi:MAG: uroporphyrinogen decarboxylase family protein [Capsulimonadaceae bacterium]|nr:uroporphyrinogen decarboxylase family protein [Capsulimonadaceae bacterium]